MPNRNQFEKHEDYLNWYRDYRKQRIKELRKYYREYNKKYRKENGYYNEQNSKNRYPEKQHARSLLYYAVKKGVIKKEPCSVCGKKKSQGHHDNYFKPLEVIWLCPLHHAERHKKISTAM